LKNLKEFSVSEISVANAFISSLSLLLFARFIPVDGLLQKLPIFRTFFSLEKSELQDRKTFLVFVAVVSVFSICLIFNKSVQLSSRLNSWLSFSALGLLIASTSAVNNFQDLKGQLWFGFGPGVALVASIVAIIVTRADLLGPQSRKLQIKSSLNLFSWIFFVVFYLPSFLQFSRGVIDPYHSTYIFNELAAPSAGRIPLSSFSSQYSSLLGYPLTLISFFSESSVLSAMPYYISALSIIVVFTLGFLMKFLLKGIPFGMSLLFSSSLVLVKPTGSSAIGGSIASLMSALPIRSIFSVLCALLLLFFCKSNFSYFSCFLLGLTTGFSLINNFEFGITSVIALLSVFSALVFLNYIAFRHLLFLIMSISLSVFVVLLGIVVCGGEFEAERWIVFSVGFGTQGFGNVPMPIFGTFFIIFAILGLGVIYGIQRLKFCKFKTSEDFLYRELPASCLALFGGVWGVLSLPYYIARSVNSGQLQIFLIPASMVIIGLVCLNCVSDRRDDLQIELPGFTTATSRYNLPLAFILCLPIGALIQHPDPNIEWPRLLGKGTEFSSSAISQSQITKEIESFRASHPQKSIGLVSSFSNLITLSVGVESVSDSNSLSDLSINDSLRESFCSSLLNSNFDWLITVRSDLSRSDTIRYCGNFGYSFIETFNSFDVYKSVKS
jgi:hypothetical protein